MTATIATFAVNVAWLDFTRAILIAVAKRHPESVVDLLLQQAWDAKRSCRVSPTLDECRAGLVGADGALQEALAWANRIKGKDVEAYRGRLQAAYERLESLLFGNSGFYPQPAKGVDRAEG